MEIHRENPIPCTAHDAILLKPMVSSIKCRESTNFACLETVAVWKPESLYVCLRAMLSLDVLQELDQVTKVGTSLFVHFCVLRNCSTNSWHRSPLHCMILIVQCIFFV